MLELLRTAYAVCDTIKDRIKLVVRNRAEFALLQEKTEELRGPILQLQRIIENNSTLPCSEHSLRNLLRTLENIATFTSQKRFKRPRNSVRHAMSILAEVYYASEDNDRFISWDKQLKGVLLSLNVGVNIQLLDYAAAAARDKADDRISSDLNSDGLELKLITERNLILDDGNLVKLGQGAFSVVIVGKYEDELVAVKQMKDVELMTGKDLYRISREALIMQNVDHANIVKMSGTSLKRGLIVMELAICSLADVLHRSTSIAIDRSKKYFATTKEPSTLSIKWKLQVCRDMMNAVAYLHQYGILHRDLKSANTLLFYDPALGTVAKIGDFGLAQALDLFSRSTMRRSTVSAVGTCNYQAPELLDIGKGQEIPYSEASDVYAGATVINEIMTRQVPWQGARDHDIFSWVSQKGERPDLWELTPTASMQERKLRSLVGGDDEKMHSVYCFAQSPILRPSADDLLRTMTDDLPSTTGNRDNAMPSSEPLPDAPLDRPTVPSRNYSTLPVMDADESDATAVADHEPTPSTRRQEKETAAVANVRATSDKLDTQETYAPRYTHICPNICPGWLFESRTGNIDVSL